LLKPSRVVVLLLLVTAWLLLLPLLFWLIFGRHWWSITSHLKNRGLGLSQVRLRFGFWNFWQLSWPLLRLLC
jgi:hypothetical protein